MPEDEAIGDRVTGSEIRGDGDDGVPRVEVKKNNGGMCGSLTSLLSFKVWSILE